MENKNSKQKGSSSSSSSSSSSIATDLFGPKATPPSTSVFGSVFGPPPTGRTMGSSHQGMGNHTSWNQAPGNAKHGGPSNVYDKDNKNTNYQQETTHPCHYSSSIYYGGQDVYSTPGRNTESHQGSQGAKPPGKGFGGRVGGPGYKKDGQDDHGSDGSQGYGASRGNWWEGSLYY